MSAFKQLLIMLKYIIMPPTPNIKIKLKRRHKGDHKAQRDLTRLGEEGTRIAYQQAIKERLETQEGTWSIEERTRQLTRARLEAVEQMIQLQEKIKRNGSQRKP